MLQKFINWCDDNHEIIMSIMFIALVAMTGIAISMTGSFFGALKTMHEMEVQLAAHGVEWALYTPIP